MPILDVNVGEIKDRELLPEDVYTGRVDNFSDLKVDKNGNKYIKIEFVIDAQDGAYRLTDHYVRLDSTRFRDFVRSTGHNDYVNDTLDLIGMECKFTVTQEAGKDDKIFNGIGKYLPK